MIGFFSETYYSVGMETALILSQTIFYSVVSLSILILGILLIVVVYHLVKITKELQEVARNIHTATDEAGERIHDILDRLSGLPILSFILKQAAGSFRARRARKKESQEQ